MNTASPALTPTTRALSWCLHLLVLGLLTLAGWRAVADERSAAWPVVAVAVACA
ncbi:sensor histidine kinase, partial [Streptomyces sp. SID685]|nr:sensor histidine kinase [Streptomyces sp. SID685]